MSVEWIAAGDSKYVANGDCVSCIVAPLDDGWRAIVIVRGEVVQRSEHLSRDGAMRFAERAARVSCALRRFEIDPPVFP